MGFPDQQCRSGFLMPEGMNLRAGCLRREIKEGAGEMAQPLKARLTTYARQT